MEVQNIRTFMLWITSNLWATWGWTISCSRMMSVRLLDISSWSWYATSEVSDSATMQYEARSGVPHCASDPVWTNSPHGAPPLSCALSCPHSSYSPDNCTVLNKCLLACLPSQMCSCSIYTATAAPLTACGCTSLIYCDMHIQNFHVWMVLLQESCAKGAGIHAVQYSVRECV
jgi:hypothetical protein